MEEVPNPRSSMRRYALVIAACVLVVAVCLILAPEALRDARAGDYGLSVMLALLLVGAAVGTFWPKRDP